MTAAWQKSLEAFFSERAQAINGSPSLTELCYVSGKDPRIWNRQEIYNDLIANIVASVGMTKESSVLEVGCASGFLAYGVAPAVNKYTGIDLSSEALHVARRLNLHNADFQTADGTNLPFPDNSFDAVFCYDVFINIPDIAVGERIIADMLRVVKPGGKILIGSIPDQALKAANEAYIAEFSTTLTANYGPPVAAPIGRANWIGRLKKRLSKVNPAVVCYYFSRENFDDIAQRLHHPMEISSIHTLNPYYAYRFNAIFTKSTQ